MRTSGITAHHPAEVTDRPARPPWPARPVSCRRGGPGAGGVLGAQDAEQAVLFVVDARGEPEGVGAAGYGGAGEQAPQARLGERLAGGGVLDLARDAVRAY